MSYQRLSWGRASRSGVSSKVRRPLVLPLCWSPFDWVMVWSATQAPARAFYWANERDPVLAKQLAQALYRAYFVAEPTQLPQHIWMHAVPSSA